MPTQTTFFTLLLRHVTRVVTVDTSGIRDFVRVLKIGCFGVVLGA